MAYQALYRTYRPQLFRDVVGQEVVVKTLQNAIANNKISHAYLFSGPRGTGKTTVARIFAKTLNCENPVLQEPCDKCRSCHEIADGISPDVIEIDAASNNGVDEIRDIREKAKFLPSGTKYKIYIIDEVHMLSTGAFNALLKTLEEPPAHVVFILATTEVQKIPSTIASRCQRFEFKALTVSEISKKLRLVCSDENVEITEEALTSIAESAEGALRDALSVLDQAISYSDEKVTIEDVNLVTGSLSYDKVIELASSFEERNVTSALEIIHALIETGKEVDKIVSGLLQFYRDMLLYKNVSSAVYAKYIFEKPKFKELAEHIDDNRIFYYVEVLSDVQNKIKYSTAPHIYLEIALIKMINMSETSLNYLDRINDLESRLGEIEENGVAGGNGGNGEAVDNEKVNANEVKINRVISELSKLELHKLIQRVDALESRPIASSDGEVKIDTSAISDLKKELEELQENVQVLKASNTTLRNQVEYISSKSQTVDLTDITNRIEALEARKVGIDYSGDIAYLKEDIDSVKIALGKVIAQIKENAIDPELADKVDWNYRKILEIIASQNKKVSTEPRRNKVPEGQMSLFDTEFSMNNANKNQVNVNFGALAREDNVEKDAIVTPTSNSSKIIEDERNASKPLFTQERSDVDYNYQESDASIIRNERMSGAYDAPVQEEESKQEEQVETSQEIVEEVKNDQSMIDEFDSSNYEQEEVSEEASVYDIEDNSSSSEELTESEEKVSNDIVEEQVEDFVDEEVSQDLDIEEEASKQEEIETEQSEVDEDTEEQTEEANDAAPVNENAEDVDINADEDEVEEEDYAEDDEESVIVEDKPVYKPSTVQEETKVEEKKPVEEATSTSEILRSEREAKEPLVVDRDKLREDLQNSRPIPSTTSEKVATCSTYDVKIIEKILHEARTEAGRNDRERVTRTWRLLDSNTDPKFSGIADRLKQGRISAVGVREFIITFASSTLCNQVMKTDFKAKAAELFKIYLGDTYDYIALPEKIWLEKREEYINQYNNGIIYPTLTPINDPNLVIIKPDQEYKDPNEKICEDAKDKFGSLIKFDN
ncbi:MAG: DNA polymerase III subunit gamma/tau [Bacilli bacterium]|nr:DNA polymerase III subunit gamma/tau [Bacilli bacterium]